MIHTNIRSLGCFILAFSLNDRFVLVNYFLRTEMYLYGRSPVNDCSLETNIYIVVNKC